jgi:hypothetical protein
MLAHYSAWPEDRQPSTNSPMASGSLLRHGPAPETKNSAWRLESGQRIQPPDGARECLSCKSRPPSQDLALLQVTLYFEIPTSRTLRRLLCTQPASRAHAGLGQGHTSSELHLHFSSCGLARVGNLAGLRPSRQLADSAVTVQSKKYLLMTLVVSQVSRRISSQLKRDCADLRQRSRSIIAASQTNSHAPRGLIIGAAGRK